MALFYEHVPPVWSDDASQYRQELIPWKLLSCWTYATIRIFQYCWLLHDVVCFCRLLLFCWFPVTETDWALFANFKRRPCAATHLRQHSLTLWELEKSGCRLTPLLNLFAIEHPKGHVMVCLELSQSGVRIFAGIGIYGFAFFFLATHQILF